MKDLSILKVHQSIFSIYKSVKYRTCVLNKKKTCFTSQNSFSKTQQKKKYRKNFLLQSKIRNPQKQATPRNPEHHLIISSSSSSFLLQPLLLSETNNTQKQWRIQDPGVGGSIFSNEIIGKEKFISRLCLVTFVF